MNRAAVAALAVIAVVAGWMLVRKALRTEEEVLSDTVDEARSALVERRRDEFLAFFTEDVRYRAKGGREDLGRDLDRWIEVRLGRVDVVSREIEVEGDRATIRLSVEVGVSVQFRRKVQVELGAVRTDDGWKVDAFDWR